MGIGNKVPAVTEYLADQIRHAITLAGSVPDLSREQVQHGPWANELRKKLATASFGVESIGGFGVVLAEPATSYR